MEGDNVHNITKGGEDNPPDADVSDGTVEEGLESNPEVVLDVGVTKRERIDIPKTMTAQEIQSQYGVSRATAWRAKKNGWLFFNYNKKVIDVDYEWASSHVEEIRESARIGSAYALKRFSLRIHEIGPFDFEDLISSACVRLMELSGHSNREDKAWRNAVASNAASDFIKTQILSVKKFFRDVEEASEEP